MGAIYYIFLFSSIIVFIFSGISLIRAGGIFTILFMMPSINFISKGASCIVLDHGSYVTELMTTTYNIYCAPIYFTLLALFYYCLSVFILLQKKRLNSNIKISLRLRFKYIIPIVCLLMIAYLILDMIISGIPLLSNGIITRFNYWQFFSTLPFASLVSNFITPLSVALGYSHASSVNINRASYKYIILLVLFLLTRFLLGFKVSGILDLVVGYLIGYIYRRYTYKHLSKNILKQILKFGIIICVFAIGSYLAYQIFSGTYKTIQEAWDALITRQFTLSNHLWWSVINDKQVCYELLPRTSSELLSPFLLVGEYTRGIGAYGLMESYAPYSIFASYFQNSIRFAPDFITVSLFYNGWIITISFIFINAFILSIFYKLFVYDAINNRIISFALLFRIFSIFNSYLTSTGTLVSFYRPNTLILIILYIAINLVENQINKLHKNDFGVKYNI